MATKEAIKLTAACVCGSIKLQLTGEPDKVYLCHCLRCRKMTGTLFSTQIMYPKSAVTITDPETRLHKFSFFQPDFPDPTQAPAPNSGWCSKCGCNAVLDFGDVYVVPYGLVDCEDDEDTRRLLDGLVPGAEACFQPQFELHCRRKPAWAKDFRAAGAKQKEVQDGVRILG